MLERLLLACFHPYPRHLDAAAGGSSMDDGYLSDKSTPTSTSSPLSSLGFTDDNSPDMETMMAVEDGSDEEEEEEAMMEDEGEEYRAASVPGTPTGLMPTIDQLFKRSFSRELEELTSPSCHSSGSLQQLPDDLTSQADQQLVILEDIQQILRDEANFELCV